MNKKPKRILAFFLALCLLSGIGIGYSNHKGKPQTDLKFIFVHGLSGWGSYDTINTFFPYWGLSGGSVIKYLNRHGYDSYAASVNPTDSAWDRACELYAQLTGSVTDYGKEHSERCKHDRYGKDFSKKPLIKDFDQSKLALFGHSFGGVTVRLFSEILINGAEAEIQANDEDDLSPFFKSGDENRQHGFQGHNANIETFESIYYFAYPTSSCNTAADGTVEPDPTITEKMFMKSAIIMSRYTGTTAGGMEIDQIWQANDGLVNAVSAKAPFGAPKVDFTEVTSIRPGIWHEMPVTRGDYMIFREE